jgi:hypothetical protein
VCHRRIDFVDLLILKPKSVTAARTSPGMPLPPDLPSARTDRRTASQLIVKMVQALREVDLLPEQLLHPVPGDP